MIWVAILLTVVCGALWVRTLFAIYQAHKSGDFPMRGMIKFYAREAVADQARPLFRSWFILSWALSFSVWFLVIALTLRTDYNFFIGLFPFFWYYFFFRYFFWEKADLSDEPAPKKPADETPVQ